MAHMPRLPPEQRPYGGITVACDLFDWVKSEQHGVEKPAAASMLLWPYIVSAHPNKGRCPEWRWPATLPVTAIRLVAHLTAHTDIGAT